MSASGASHKALARALLGRILGFRDCPASTLDELVACGHLRECLKGDCVVHRGQAFDHLGIVVTGTFESSLTRPDGHRHLVGLMQRGDIIGMVPLLDGLGHVNDLWVRAAGSILLIPGADVRRMHDAEPLLVRALERQLAFRTRLLYDRLTTDPALPLQTRVAILLQTLCTLYGLPRAAGTVLDMKLTQTDLADWLGVSRQSINTAVKQLEVDGVIRLAYSAVEVLDNALLAERAKRTWA